MTFSNWSKILPWKIGTVDSQQTKNRIISKSFCRGILAGWRGADEGCGQETSKHIPFVFTSKQ